MWDHSPPPPQIYIIIYIIRGLSPLKIVISDSNAFINEINIPIKRIDIYSKDKQYCFTFWTSLLFMVQKETSEDGRIIIVNSILPVKGFVAMIFFDKVLFRREYYTTLHPTLIKIVLNHERIHSCQMQRLEFGPKFIRKYLGMIRFYIRYFFLWIRYGYNKHPYELEAKKYEYDFNYLKS